MGDTSLTFPEAEASKLERHLPPGVAHAPSGFLPFVTLTFATSLDSALALAPGARTALSGPESKAMTHYLRSRHDAICVGVGTALADDPGLNCRIRGVGAARQPRPIIIDPRLRWQFTESSKVMQLARTGRGLAPYIVTTRRDPPARQRDVLQRVGGKYIVLEAADPANPRFQWKDILRAVRAQGLRSIMIEGGGQIISSLLEPANARLIDSVVVTVAPTWLGQGSVVVSPPRKLDANGQPMAAARLADPTWIPLGEDVVLCGSIAKS